MPPRVSILVNVLQKTQQNAEKGKRLSKIEKEEKTRYCERERELAKGEEGGKRQSQRT